MKKKKAAPRKAAVNFTALGAAADKKAFGGEALKAPPHFAEVTAGVVNALKNAPASRPQRTREGSIVCRVRPGVQEELRNAAETLGMKQVSIVEEAIMEWVARKRRERQDRGVFEWLVAPPVRKTRNAQK
jgi:hypothetical protein